MLNLPKEIPAELLNQYASVYLIECTQASRRLSCAPHDIPQEVKNTCKAIARTTVMLTLVRTTREVYKMAGIGGYDD
jgi:hypothetical protein